MNIALDLLTLMMMQTRKCLGAKQEPLIQTNHKERSAVATYPSLRQDNAPDLP